MNNVFLGKPPASIEAWIKSHRPTPPAEPEETTFYYKNPASTGGLIKETFLIDKYLDADWLIEHGYRDENASWQKEIVKIEVGSKVQEVGAQNAF